MTRPADACRRNASPAAVRRVLAAELDLVHHDPRARSFPAILVGSSGDASATALSDLGDVRKDLGEGVRVGRSIDIGGSIFGGSSSGQNAA
jgi:hypothetical protein